MPREEEPLKMDAEGANETPVVTESGGGELARPSDVLPGLLHILPLANRPFFPAQMVPLVVEREPWQRTVEAAVETGQHVGLVLIRGDDPQTAGPDDFYTMGTASRIHKVVQLDDKLQLFVEGLQRFRIASWVTRERPFAVRAEYFPETSYKDMPEIKAYTVAVINTIKELLPLNPLYGEELKYFLNRFGPEDPARLADFAASLTTSNKQELQEVLEKTHIRERMEKVSFESDEIRKVVEAIYLRLHTEYRLAKIVPPRLSLLPFVVEFKKLEERADAFRDSPVTMMTEQHFVIKKFFITLVSQARQLFTECNTASKNWFQAAVSPVFAQIRQHKATIDRSFEALKKIHENMDSLGERIAELEHVRQELENQMKTTDTLLERIHRPLSG